MVKANILNTRTISYLELIGNGRSYRVPRYQRCTWRRQVCFVRFVVALHRSLFGGLSDTP